MRRKKLLIPAVLVLLLIVVSFGVGIARNGATTSTAPASSQRSSSTSTSTAPACPAILVGPSTASNVTQIPAATGANYTLDSSQLFGAHPSGSSYHWTQLFASRTELDYVSSFNATLWNTDTPAATVRMNEPGNYRFGLTVTGTDGSVSSYKVDLLAKGSPTTQLKDEGVIFSDVFQNLGGTNFQLGPYSPACQTREFDSAMNGPARVGAGWVGFVPAAFYTRVSPSPVIGSNNTDLSLTNDSYYFSLIASAKAQGFKVVQFEQLGVGPDTPAAQAALLPAMMNNSAWWDQWYTQWKAWLVDQAARAQKAGVDMLVLCLYCESSFQPQVYPQYAERWDDIIDSVRQVFSGQVAMSLIVTDDRFTMYDKLDAVFATIFPGLYTSAGAFKDPDNPTMAELQNQTQRLFSYASFLAGKIDVYYIFLAYSSLGEYEADPYPWGNQPPPANLTDFRAQAMYYEAFFSVLKNETWVTGAFSERWDYFDHFARLNDSPSSYYFDQTIGNSPRNKPAESVIRLWFGLL